MTTSTARAAGSVVAASVIGVSIWMASMIGSDMTECVYSDDPRCAVDHSSNGLEKDQPGLIATIAPAVTVLPTPEITATPPVEIPETDAFEDLPACPTEDSEGCYWDADTMGNGTGNDVVTPPAPPVTEPEPLAPFEPNTGPREAWDTGVLECGINAAPAVDQDQYGNWWAYCEPALINEDGTHWDGVTP